MLKLNLKNSHSKVFETKIKDKTHIYIYFDYVSAFSKMKINKEFSATYKLVKADKYIKELD